MPLSASDRPVMFSADVATPVKLPPPPLAPDSVRATPFFSHWKVRGSCPKTSGARVSGLLPSCVTEAGGVPTCGAARARSTAGGEVTGPKGCVTTTV